jgi:hypothetical protein
MSTVKPETAQLHCPQCQAAVSSESAICSACGAVLIGVPLSPPEAARATQPQLATPAQPLPEEQPTPGGAAPQVVIHNYAGKPPAQKTRRSYPHLWLAAFPVMGVLLILGLLLILVLPKGSHPTVPAPRPTPTATAIPQARVIVQLVDVMCSVTRDFFSADSFYIKSNLAAQSVGGGNPTVWNKTTNHYTINDGQSASFNQADRTIFEANVPLAGIVTGSLTAYADDETQQLGTTDLKISPSESGQTYAWPINGQSGKVIINTWSYTVHYSTTITRLAQAPAMGGLSAGNSWLRDADTPALQGRLA